MSGVKIKPAAHPDKLARVRVNAVRNCRLGPNVVTLSNGLSLDRREVQILLCVQTGATNREIGNLLMLSEGRIKGLICELGRRVGKRTRTGLAVWALDQELRPRERYVTALADREAPLVELSTRELDVLRCVARGMTNHETGRALGLSSLTIRSHMSRIKLKLNTGSRTLQAVVLECQLQPDR